MNTHCTSCEVSAARFDRMAERYEQPEQLFHRSLAVEARETARRIRAGEYHPA
jgi:hypothetical protein